MTLFGCALEMQSEFYEQKVCVNLIYEIKQKEKFYINLID